MAAMASPIASASTPRDASWLVQRQGETDWEAQYRFTLRPHRMADFAERCLFQQTSPDSHFTQRRICSLALPDGRITLSDLRLITSITGVRDERDLGSEDEYRDRLGAAIRHRVLGLVPRHFKTVLLIG